MPKLHSTRSVNKYHRRQVLKGLAAIGAGAVALGSGAWSSAAAAVARMPKFGRWGFDTSGMDKSVAPGDNFAEYAGGAWKAKAEIPADRSRWGAFNVLREQALFDVRDVVEAAAKTSPAPGSVERKVVDYYNSYLDVDAINKRGMAPTRDDLDRIAAAKDHAEIARIASEPAIRSDLPVALYVTLDAKRPTTYVMGVYQSGLGLPDRDYYLKDDKRFAEARTKYKAYIQTLLKAADWDDPAGNAEAIYNVEHKMAELHWPRAKNRNRDLTYNPHSAAELRKLAPEYPWDAAIDAWGASGQDFYNVAQPDAVQGLAKVFRDTPVDTWRAYLAFHYVDAMASVLPKEIDDASFDFYSRTLSGIPEQQDRWKRAVNHLNHGILNEAAGQLYVKKHFRPEEKEAARQLVNNLIEAYKKRISKLAWMGDETKKAALEKLEKMTVKIGYPDKWRDYSLLEVTPGDAFGNRKQTFAFDRMLDKQHLAGPADKSEWFMGPQSVNAYNQSKWNEIVFPAAILQPPFFDFAADDAVNYGAIGAVIGHEMGHSFDDQGAKTDANGVLRNWWTDKDRERFKALTKSLADQYSKFEPLPGVHINGELTLGENIGDLGGLNVALEAYGISQGGKEPPVLDGFTGLQRFFLGFSQIYRTKIRDAALRRQIATDPHSPDEFRANGTVRNLDAWYLAFNVKPDNKLYLPPKERVRIW